MFTDVNEAFEWMVSFTNLEKKPDLTKRGYRLDKMEQLLELFNNPHEAYKIIHVAGSKGKGSTCGFIGSILSEAGYKTGIYSSPHLLDFRERITNNHHFFKKESYLNAINKIKYKISKLDPDYFSGGEPTTFELMTLAAFIIFKIEKCDWVVLETGLGGRLDSTNIVNPEASIITPIELEHTDLLGDTLEAIAYEKAGIIKKERIVFTSNKNKAVLGVIKDKASELHSDCIILPKIIKTDVTTEGTTLYYGDNNYKLGLEGEIQGENALLALTTVKHLLPTTSNDVIKNGLRKTSIPGRFQEFDHYPTIILDGAHTENSIKTTIKTFTTIYGQGTIIFGALDGKNIDSMAKQIKQFFNSVIISTPGTFKHSDIRVVEQIFINNKIETTLIKSPSQALERAIQIGKTILVTGSFYMAGEVAKILECHEKK